MGRGMGFGRGGPGPHMGFSATPSFPAVLKFFNSGTPTTVAAFCGFLFFVCSVSFNDTSGPGLKYENKEHTPKDIQ